MTPQKSDDNSSSSLQRQQQAAVFPDIVGRIRFWGYLSIGLGILQIIRLDALSITWGVLLVLVGLAVLYYQTSAAFVVDAIVTLWAGSLNLFSGTTLWVLFGLAQILVGFIVFNDYYRYKNPEDQHFSRFQSWEMFSTSYYRAGQGFPLLGFIIGLLALVAFLGSVISLFFVGTAPAETLLSGRIPGIYGLVFNLAQALAVLAVSLCLAALLSKFDRRRLTILGIVFGGLVILVNIILSFFA
jgi:hypothetical protein